MKADLLSKLADSRKIETDQWQRLGAENQDYQRLTRLEYLYLFNNNDIRIEDMTENQLKKLLMFRFLNIYLLDDLTDDAGVARCFMVLHDVSELVQETEKKRYK